ncbi:hypothetical protein [Mesorhizobium sp. B2-8-9]|uniref:DUF7668 domain-containing protein n=1 Tax=Mesorhizobium sp. B2-8-9 TaxID=2589899 RepID=UPI00112C4C2C|nr:hypothetical protein [Mesorhizobium sp. B2-8-9]TPI72110.1 hypothetical protein FJ423_27835 [Mesorhizobium sp. B2-8-9]
MTTEEEIVSIVRDIEKMLFEKDYKGIENITYGVRLRAKDIENAVLHSGLEIGRSPAGMPTDVDIVRIEAEAIPSYSVVYDLWSTDGTRSDLSIEMTIFFGRKGHRVEFDNIHVR